MKTLMVLVVMSVGLSAMAKPCNLAGKNSASLFSKTAYVKATSDKAADTSTAVKKNGKS